MKSSYLNSRDTSTSGPFLTQRTQSTKNLLKPAHKDKVNFKNRSNERIKAEINNHIFT